ncbi:NAD(P)-dependent oxidoreductase [Saprospiraceae bacterium]|nr:NAD(P)-dependent oxidoreductase [Saprospiraceae bacterium]
MIKLENRKVAVFGCNGYIGRHLVSHYLKMGHEVCGFDIQVASEQETGSRFSYFQTDVSSEESVNSIDFDFDIILLFSGLTGTAVSFANYRQFIEVNEIGLLNVLERIRLKNSEVRIIFPSTRLIYEGLKNELLEESSDFGTKTIYAINKIACELYLKSFHERYSLDYCVARIGVPYGNMVGSTLSYGTLGFFLSKVVKAEPITLYGSGEVRRTFTFVGDVCEQIYALGNIQALKSRVFNIAGENFSLKNIANSIDAIFGFGVNYIPWPEDAKLLESGDTIFDDSLIRKEINYKQTIDFKTWIDQLEIQ